MNITFHTLSSLILLSVEQDGTTDLFLKFTFTIAKLLKILIKFSKNLTEFPKLKTFKVNLVRFKF